MNPKNASITIVSLAIALAAGVGGCKDKGSAAGSGSGSCPYKSKIGFCVAPPAGTTPEESADKVVFKTAGKPSPAQDLVVRSEDFPLDTTILKSKRDFAKGSGAGNTVLEDIDLAGGKGFYVARQTSSNVLVTAIVIGPNKNFFECSYNVYVKDKDALKAGVQACKSLRVAD